MERRFGTRFVIKLEHFGCWATGLNFFLCVTKDRKDLRMLIYVLDVSTSSYKVLLLIQSKEGKEIDKALADSIRDFLLDHEIVQAAKPNLPKTENALPFLLLIHDENVNGAIRTITKNGCWIDPLVGTIVEDGYEAVTAFANDSSVVGRILEDYSRQPTLFKVLAVDIGRKYNSLEDIVNDENYLITQLLNNPETRKKIIDEIILKAKKLLKLTQLVETIAKHAWWLIPLLKEIIKWLGSDGKTGGYIS
jgi:hypothetical protein